MPILDTRIRNIDTYRSFRPRYTGVLTSETSGRRWRISLIPLDAAIQGLPYPTSEVAWSNTLVWNVGRGDEPRPSNFMGTSCTVALKDPGGGISAWLFDFETAERIKLLVEELPSQGLKPVLGFRSDGAPRHIRWLGSLYAEDSEAPFYADMHTQTLQITAYDQLGKMDKEEAIQSAVDSKGDRVPFPVYLHDAYSEILWAFADLDIELVQPIWPDGSNTHVQQVRLSEGLQGDTVRDQMDLLMESFGTRLFQTFEGRWRIQHAPTWPEGFNLVSPPTQADSRAQMIRHQQVAFFSDTYITTPLALQNSRIEPFIVPVDPEGNFELMHGRQRKAGKIIVEREGRENFARDPDLNEHVSTTTRTGQTVRQLRHWRTYAGPLGEATVQNGQVSLRHHAGISQGVMRISPLADGYARIMIKSEFTNIQDWENTSRLDGGARAALLVKADSGRIYAWRDAYVTDPATGRTERVRRWEIVPSIFPARQEDLVYFDIGYYQRTWMKWYKYSVPLEDLPEGGTLYAQAWNPDGRLQEVTAIRLKICDDRKNALPTFDVVIGHGEDRENVELDTIDGAQYSGSAATWLDPVKQQTFPDLVEWQALDAAGIRGVDSSRLEGRLRRIIPPEGTLLARDLSGEAAHYVPLSITVEAAPFEATSGTWVQLPKNETPVDDSLLDRIRDFFSDLF